MNAYLIIIVSILYFSIGVGCIRQKDYAHALVWFGYTLANIGLILYEWNKSHPPVQ